MRVLILCLGIAQADPRVTWEPESCGTSLSKLKVVPKVEGPSDAKSLYRNHPCATVYFLNSSEELRNLFSSYLSYTKDVQLKLCRSLFETCMNGAEWKRNAVSLLIENMAAALRDNPNLTGLLPALLGRILREAVSAGLPLPIDDGVVVNRLLELGVQGIPVNEATLNEARHSCCSTEAAKEEFETKITALCSSKVFTSDGCVALLKAVEDVAVPAPRLFEPEAYNVSAESANLVIKKVLESPSIYTFEKVNQEVPCLVVFIMGNKTADYKKLKAAWGITKLSHTVPQAQVDACRGIGKIHPVV